MIEYGVFFFNLAKMKPWWDARENVYNEDHHEGVQPRLSASQTDVLYVEMIKHVYVKDCVIFKGPCIYYIVDLILQYDVFR